MDDTVPATTRRSPIAALFVGADGLRAGWSLLIFAMLIFSDYLTRV